MTVLSTALRDLHVMEMHDWLAKGPPESVLSSTHAVAVRFELKGHIYLQQATQHVSCRVLTPC